MAVLVCSCNGVARKEKKIMKENAAQLEQIIQNEKSVSRNLDYETELLLQEIDSVRYPAYVFFTDASCSSCVADMVSFLFTARQAGDGNVPTYIVHDGSHSDQLEFFLDKFGLEPGDGSYRLAPVKEEYPFGRKSTAITVIYLKSPGEYVQMVYIDKELFLFTAS